MPNIYFGTESYPLIDFDYEGNLGARSDDSQPIQFETNLNAPENIDLNDYAYGLYIRNMPSRSLLNATNSEMDRRNQLNDPELRTYASGFLGAPGTGKTFFFNNLGRIMHKKGALMVDCSDKDLKTLFENPSFDTQAANREKAAIDAKIRMHNMGISDSISEKSLSLLKKIVGSAWIEDNDGHITIDWTAIQFAGNDMAAYEHQVEVFQNVLKEICKAEGIDVSNNAMNIGITMQDGELFRVFDPQSPDYGRPVILDELNRAKYGTMDNLYGLLNFLNSPNMKTFRIKGANGREITIDKQNMPKTFYLNFTGNQAIEGMGSQLFNNPFLSRMPEGFALKTIPDTKPADLADMISSYLMGVPGTLLSEAFNVDFQNQQGTTSFIDFLKHARTIGLTEKQRQEIPEWQLRNIENAVQIIPLSFKMGRFFYEIKELIHQRGDYQKIAEEISIEPEYEAYLKQKTVDFRTIPHFFIEADIIKGTVSKVKLPKLGAKSDLQTNTPSQLTANERYATRGNRLQTVMKEWIYQTFKPADMGVRKIEENMAEKMYQKALQIAYQNNILPQPNKEAKSASALISSLYNIQIRDSGIYYQNLQSLIVNTLRQIHPDIHADEKDEDILPLSVVNATIQSLASEENISPLKAAYEAHNLLIINEDVDEIGTQMITPGILIEDQSGPSISANNFLLSLSLPEISSKNLENIFQGSFFTNLSEEYQSLVDYKTPGDHKFGFFKTINAQKEPSYILAFYNKREDNLIVVGDEVLPAVQKAFSHPNRTYIDRTKTDINKIVSAVTQLLDEEDFVTECAMCDIYGWKNVSDLKGILERPSNAYQDEGQKARSIINKHIQTNLALMKHKNGGR